MAVDTAGNLYIADASGHRVLRIARFGIITVIAGNGLSGYSGDGGSARKARLAFPQSIALDVSGNLFIADVLNHRIRKVSPEGNITTVAGDGEKGNSGDGGNAVRAQLDHPLSVAVDTAGNLYVALIPGPHHPQ